jgi:hypothetical protein
MASHFLNGIELLSIGLRSVGIFVAVTVVAGLLVQISDTLPIVLAPLSSPMMAGAARVLPAGEPFDADSYRLPSMSGRREHIFG